MIFKMQPNALLTWQNFIIVKSGCYKPTPPPFKMILALEIQNAGKKLWVICHEFFFKVPCSFVFNVVTPLYLAHLITLLQVTRSVISRILIGLSRHDRSPPRSGCSIGICSSRTHKHFLSCDTWNTSCTSNSYGGSSS
jgi:hypothetical protein